MRASQIGVILGCAVSLGVAAAAENGGIELPSSVAQMLHQWGLAGLAGFLVWVQWQTHERMASALNRHEILLIELVRENAALGAKSLACMESLRDELRERPCLQAREERK
jgi:hypothetical protein